jgi:hypothetical protein
MEREAQADIDAGQVETFDTVEEALAHLDRGAETNAQD